MGRKIAAAIAGIVLAVLLIAVVERIGHLVYPVPADLDLTDTEELRAYVDTLPVGALLFVLLAWLIGTFAGGLLASFIARENFRLYKAVVGGMVLLGAAISFVSIPHPLWFSIVSVLAIIAMSFVTCEVARRILVPEAR